MTAGHGHDGDKLVAALPAAAHRLSGPREQDALAPTAGASVQVVLGADLVRIHPTPDETTTHARLRWAA
jgi:hypothetical protein